MCSVLPGHVIVLTSLFQSNKQDHFAAEHGHKHALKPIQYISFIQYPTFCQSSLFLSNSQAILSIK